MQETLFGVFSDVSYEGNISIITENRRDGYVLHEGTEAELIAQAGQDRMRFVHLYREVLTDDDQLEYHFIATVEGQKSLL